MYLINNLNQPTYNNTKLYNKPNFKGNLESLLKSSTSDKFITSPFTKAYEYIQKMKNLLETQGEKLETISQLDPNKLSGILDGLPTFKNIKTKDIGLLNNILIINTQRGCNNGCGHCYLLAKPTKSYNEPTIGWETYKQIFQDFGTLNSRLGFNVLGKKFEFAYNYADSDPIEFCSIDKVGKKHNIAEAAEFFYNKIGKPLDFSTAGWDIDNEFENNAAKEIVAMVKSKPQVLRNVDISIHPFHKYMLKANSYYKKSQELKYTNPEQSEYYMQLYIKSRQAYVDRMANVLATFAPIMKPGYSHIDSQYIFANNPLSIFTKQETENLCNEILERTKELCEKDNIKSYILSNGTEAFKNECMYPPRKIYNTPRIKSNPLKELPNTFSTEIKNGKLNIVVEPFDKTFYNFFENEISENIKTTLKEDKNSFSKIILNVDLNNNISSKLKDAQFLNREDAINNFYERVDNTLNIYSEIPKDKLKIKIKFNSNEDNIVPLEKLKEFIKGKYPNIRDIELIDTSEEEKTLLQSKPTEEILNMLYHLKPATRRNFVSRMKKAIDIDGNLVLLIYNKPYFGTGNFQDISIKVDNLMLDTNPTFKDKPFLNLLNIPL